MLLLLLLCVDGFYTTEEVKTLYLKDMTTLRDQLREFFGQKPFPTKFLYFVTRLDFVKPDPNENLDEEEDEVSRTGDKQAEKAVGVEDVISFYVAICGNGSVMVPMSIFPPIEEWHWERKKTVKLRHAHSMHRTKMNDPNEALQFFAVVRGIIFLLVLKELKLTFVGLFTLCRRGKSFTRRRPSTATSLRSCWTTRSRSSGHPSSWMV